MHYSCIIYHKNKIINNFYIEKIMIKIAINGFGRIGRNVLRILFENKIYEHVNIMAINDSSCENPLNSIYMNLYL